jgi:hypothetical protein
VTAWPHVYTDSVHLIVDANVWVLRDDKGLYRADRERLEMLHAFAASIGFRRSWFQTPNRPHYDVTTPPAAERAIRAGANLVSVRDLAMLSYPTGATRPIARPEGWTPTLLGHDMRERIALARSKNVRLMRMFAGNRRVGLRGVYHIDKPPTLL